MSILDATPAQERLAQELAAQVEGTMADTRPEEFDDATIMELVQQYVFECCACGRWKDVDENISGAPAYEHVEDGPMCYDCADEL